MKKLVIPILLFIGIGLTSFTEDKSKKELRGDKYFTTYAFDKAIEIYSHTKHLSTDGQRHLAMSYHLLNQNVKAEIAYAKLTNETTGVLPEDYYSYAMILKGNGKFEESIKWMEKFKDAKPNDLRAKSYAANGDKLSEMRNDDGKYKVTHLDMNTDAEDFGTSYYKDKVVFSSTRERPKFIEHKYNWNRKPFLDMYVSSIDKEQLSKPENFDKKLNRKLHEGSASFSKDGNFVAFTRNDYDTKRKDKIVELQICFSTYKDGKWSDPMPFVLNSKDYSVGQPFLTPDGNTMYFTSDMPGGYGGADLYRVFKNEKGEWGKAENLGDKINTEGDEMFPFLETSNGVFFFSSNGQFGLGGQDIFICATNGSGFGPIRNAGYPLNTPQDDFAAIVDGKLSTGYISSNRTGGSGDDDIYSFDILKDLGIGKRLQGIAKEKNGTELPNSFITLLDTKGNVLDTLTTRDSGKYSFLVKSDADFKLKGEKKTYWEGDNTANTFGKEFLVKADLILIKKEEAEPTKLKVGDDLGKVLKAKPLVYDSEKSGIRPEAETVYFDLDKYNIRPDAEKELEQIVKVMNEYPEMTIELGSYTDCRASKEYNQVLSDKRAKATVDFIRKRITKPERIYGKGYGKTKLLNGCDCDGEAKSTCSDEEHQKNRRTEFIIVKK
jgi:outer membrane protein OmpA-like peptidoglycan-associated protein